jgi:hypothetical protein
MDNAVEVQIRSNMNPRLITPEPWNLQLQFEVGEEVDRRNPIPAQSSKLGSM